MRLFMSLDGVPGAYEINSSALALAWRLIRRTDGKTLQSCDDGTPPLGANLKEEPTIGRIDGEKPTTYDRTHSTEAPDS